MDPVDASDKSVEPSSRGNNSSYNDPQTGGGRPPRSNTNNYSYNQQSVATPTYAPSSNQPQYAPQYSMPQSNGPPSSSYGGYDGMYGSNPTPYPDGRPRSSTSSRGSWGSQPPLTSSKRDQTWEAKRRLWAARRQQDGRSTSSGSTRGGNPYSSGGFAPTPPPFYGHIPQNEIGPPSPLTKFMHQQQIRVDYERIGTAQSTTAANGGYPPNQYGASQATTTGGATDYYAAPSSSYSGQMGQRASTSSYGDGTSCDQPPPPMSRAGLTSSSSHGCQTPGTAAYGRSSTRQPPGGHSNWSPFN